MPGAPMAIITPNKVMGTIPVYQQGECDVVLVAMR